MVWVESLIIDHVVVIYILISPRDDQRSLAVVGILDARTSKMQDKDNRLIAARALFSEDAVQAVAVGAERTERVADCGATSSLR